MASFKPVKVDTGGNLAQAVSGDFLDFTNGGFGFSTCASGDLFYASAANTPAKLAKSSNGQWLKLVSGLPAWASLPLTYVTTISGRVTTTGSAQTVGSQVTDFAAGTYLFVFDTVSDGTNTVKPGYKVNAGSDVFPTSGVVLPGTFALTVTLSALDDVTFRTQVSSANNYHSLRIYLVG